VIVDFRLPPSEARTSAGAHRAGRMRAVIGPPINIKVEGLVSALGGIVVKDVVRTHDDTRGTAGTQAPCHDFFVERFPVEFFGSHLLIVVRRAAWCRYRGGTMPEILEIEYYRILAQGALMREIDVVEADQLASKRLETGIALADIFSGLRFTEIRRIGKLLIFDTEGPSFGMRFGMTGGLVLDGTAAIKGLRYGPEDIEQKWIRARVRFQDGGSMELHDPRRLARVLVDPDEDALGPDALHLSLGEFRTALGARGEGPAIKARLLDQSKIAGIGNLLADEMLWRAGVSPLRGCATLSDDEIRRLHRNLKATLTQLLQRGGSHTGDHMIARHPGGSCPKDGQALFRQSVGGRTTYWCPKHQR